MTEPICIRVGNNEPYCLNVEETYVYDTNDLLDFYRDSFDKDDSFIFQMGLKDKRFVIFAHKVNLNGVALSNNAMSQMGGCDIPAPWHNIDNSEIDFGQIGLPPPGLFDTTILTTDKNVLGLNTDPILNPTASLVYLGNPAVNRVESLMTDYVNKWVGKLFLPNSISCEEIKSELERRKKEGEKAFALGEPPSPHANILISHYIEKELLPMVIDYLPKEVASGLKFTYGTSVGNDYDIAEYNLDNNDTINFGANFFDMTKEDQTHILLHEIGHRYYNKYNQNIIDSILSMAEIAYLRYSDNANMCVDKIAYATVSIALDSLERKNPFDELFAEAFAIKILSTIQKREITISPDAFNYYTGLIKKLPTELSIPLTIRFLYTFPSCPFFSIEEKALLSLKIANAVFGKKEGGKIAEQLFLIFE